MIIEERPTTLEAVFIGVVDFKNRLFYSTQRNHISEDTGEPLGETEVQIGPVELCFWSE